MSQNDPHWWDEPAAAFDAWLAEQDDHVREELSLLEQIEIYGAARNAAMPKAPKQRYAVFGPDGWRLGFVEATTERGAKMLASRSWVRWKQIWACASLKCPDAAHLPEAAGWN